MNDAVGIGHNNPPEDDGPLLQRANELIAAADQWGIVANADQAARLGDFITQLRESSADLEKAEKVKTGPLTVAIEAIRNRFRRPREGLKLALSRARALSSDWLARERDRLIEAKAEADRQAEQARQIAERQQQEAMRTGRVEDQMSAALAIEEADILAEQAGKAPVKAMIRSDLAGKAISSRTTWVAEITDAAKARKAYSKNSAVLAALDEAIIREATKLARTAKSEAGAPAGIRFVARVTAA